MDPARYVVPDWTSEVDLAAYVRGIPASACIKGVFPAAVVDAARKKKVLIASARPKYHPFADVPLREYVPILYEAAVGIYPKLPPREALRKMGRASRDAFEQSMLGRVLLAGFLDMHTNLSVVAKATSIAMPAARIVVRDQSKGRAIVALTNVHTFIDSHFIGILEKAGSASSNRVDARVHLSTPYDGEVELTW